MTITMSAKTGYPPGPTGLACAKAIQGLRRDPLNTLTHLARTYGDFVHVGLGPYHIYLLNHPHLLHQMLVRQADIMHKPRSLSRPVADFLGHGLLVSHGTLWQHQRRLIQPAFHHRQVHQYGQVMVDCILQQLETWQPDDVFDIDHEFMKMTLQMVTRALFHDEIQDTDSVAEAVKILQRISYQQGQDPLGIPTWVPLPDHLLKQRVMKQLDKLVFRMIQARRAAGAHGDDLLSTLINAADGHGTPLTDQQIRDEVMTLLLAGHESTANAMTWTWYLLAQHPHASARLMEELDAVLRGRPPAIEDLRHLPYNAMIIKEALRLYPPAWALPRENIADTTIDGYHIRKGALLLGVPYVIQRDPRYFEDPDQFLPERFADNAERHLPQHVYMPFGGGPRFCVGNTFALTAMQLALATIHQRFHLSLVADQAIVLDPLLTLRPRYGVHMTAHAAAMKIGSPH